MKEKRWAWSVPFKRSCDFDPLRWIDEEVLHQGFESHDGCDLYGNVDRVLIWCTHRLAGGVCGSRAEYVKDAWVHSEVGT